MPRRPRSIDPSPWYVEAADGISICTVEVHGCIVSGTGPRVLGSHHLVEVHDHCFELRQRDVVRLCPPFFGGSAGQREQRLVTLLRVVTRIKGAVLVTHAGKEEPTSSLA